MIAEGQKPLLPPNPAPYLTAWLFDIGPTAPSSMGEGVIGYQDLQAWQDVSGIALLPWEGSVLKRLSRVYLGASQRATDPGCAQPYSGTADDLAAGRDLVTQQIKAAFAGARGG